MQYQDTKNFFVFPIKNRGKTLSHSTSRIKKFFLYFFVGFLLLEFLPVFSPVLLLFFFFFMKVDLLYFLPILIISIFLSLYFIYLIFFKFNNIIKFKYYTLNSKGKLKKPFEFVFVSDLHIGSERYGTKHKRLQKIIDLINRLNVNYLFFGGDFISKHFQKELFEDLKYLKPKYKYAVYGNHDTHYLFPGGEGKDPLELIEYLKKNFNINFLNNSGVSIFNNQIFLGGVVDLWSKHFDIDKTFRNSNRNQFRILLSHNPDIIDFLTSENEPDLILSGHNHGGQINFKIFGFNLHLPLPSKYQNLLNGVYDISKNCNMVLSSGVGHSATRVRIGSYSEIVFIKIS